MVRLPFSLGWVALLAPLLALLATPAPLQAQTVFTVTNTSDGGAGSLRQALLDANADPDLDEVRFNIPGAGPHTIAPASALPTITDPVVMDGYTQPGSSPNTNPFGQGLNTVLRIELNGTSAGIAHGLVIAAGGSTVRGLVINRFSDQAILIQQQGGNVIEGCFLNTNVAGTAGLGSGFSAVYVDDVPNNRIGGVTPAARNLLVGRSFHGIELDGTGATGNRVEGNIIGTDVSGTASLGATFFGVTMFEAASGNVIGGTAPGAGNVISGNGSWGVALQLNATGNRVEGNYIGTDAAGLAALPNGSDGVRITEGATNNVVGGADPAARNVISGNDGDGVEIQEPGSTGNRIEGNYIGTDRTGLAPLPNADNGVELDDAAGNVVGGTASGAGNVIAFNTDAGVSVLPSGTGNAVRGNALFENGGLGVDLDPLGPTPNDPGDGDDGPNRSQNFPEIASAELDDTFTLFVTYAVPSSTATSAYPLTVEVFLADADAEEGMTLLGSDTYDASEAQATVTAGFPTAPIPIGEGDRIVATATDADGNTSEFSFPVAPVVVVPANEQDTGGPAAFALSEPSPNPTAREAALTLTLGRPQRVVVEVLDVTGRRLAVLKEGPLAAGAHALGFEAGGLPGGVYVVRATGEGVSVARRVTLVR